jgi:hypothetical protein
MNVTGIGISFAGPAVPSEVMVRDNEIFAVVAPAATAAGASGAFGPAVSGASLGQELSFGASQSPVQVIPATGIQISSTATATIENNSVALIGNGGTTGAIGINTQNAATLAVNGNDLSDIGPAAAGGHGTSYGINISADAIGNVNVANNVIRQTTSGAKSQISFNGINIGPNIEPSSPDGFTGTAILSGNMVFGNDAYLVTALVADCILNANLCDLAAGVAADPSAAVIATVGDTCIASSNRVFGAGKLTGLSVSVNTINKDLATVVGNIVSTAIRLNGAALLPMGTAQRHRVNSTSARESHMQIAAFKMKIDRRSCHSRVRFEAGRPARRGGGQGAGRGQSALGR